MLESETKRKYRNETSLHSKKVKNNNLLCIHTHYTKHTHKNTHTLTQPPRTLSLHSSSELTPASKSQLPPSPQTSSYPGGTSPFATAKTPAILPARTTRTPASQTPSALSKSCSPSLKNCPPVIPSSKMLLHTSELAPLT
ncbi:hypothetical protein BCR33DRAFT_572591 [Rhizoclosmatium globosum]|uniref:Uncharacterized protein n=1 Tax=Rhizoclosmatium globosum TaxID=329046 RepID=A0A1Y2B5X2_9FUNG|nr:hypothetical protein BCR33DRAFT_572591 [Rhizoclosmatium globosum]|eukprot:ORY29940.1 hypothetical protein BCR33DRAFT_572591 [Rhizoclosmatium globosum]